MTSKTHYYEIPLLTKLFKIIFYLYWQDDKFNKMGFYKRDKKTLEEAFMRLERKRIWRESIKN